MRKLSGFFWSLGVCLLFACGNGSKRDIGAFYFPVKDLKGGKVYEYVVSQNDSVMPEYWFYRTFVRDSGLFLVGTYYDHRFQIGQIIREKITKSGALAKECHLYEADPDPEVEGGQIHTRTIIDLPNKFPYSVTDSSAAFVFKLQFHPPDDPESTIFVERKRRFLGDAPDFEYDGKKYPCVRFGLEETIGNEKAGIEPVKSQGEEWYAKGLGLVYYRKSYGTEAFKVEARLTDIFTMAELEERATAVFGE
ncbi:MAG TPA: hypothetical protein VK168_05495 [Saprospiraceae bacterium]|nr:hypothetical protein [Saprospiraceae bacterium]